MRILHIGMFGTQNPCCPLANAFMNQCNDFMAINTNEPNIDHNIITLIRRWKPELVFMHIQSAGKISVNTVKKLKYAGVFIINWNGDVRDSTPEWMVEIAPYVLSCFSNMRDVNYIRSLGYKSEWLESWVDTELYKPEVGWFVNQSPIVFMGNNNSNFPLSAFRIEMCKELKREYKDKFSVYGNGKDADYNLNHSQKAEADAYKGARIAINCSHYEIEKYTSDRMLRILSMGTPICLAKEYPNMPYIDGVHLRTWNTIEQLKELINYYLDPTNETERQTIANNGRELILNNYTHTHFVNNLKSFIC